MAAGPPPPSLEDAQKSIAGRQQSLEEKIHALDKEIHGYKSQMAKMRPGPAKDGIKRKAMAALKRRKVYEQQRDSLMSQGFNLDQASFVQSSLADTQTTVAAMKAANSTMKTQFQSIDPDDVYNLQDDMQGMFDQHYEIQEALSRTYETPDGFDEEELGEFGHVCVCGLRV